MDETRRDFIKGMFASGTFLALGVPELLERHRLGRFSTAHEIAGYYWEIPPVPNHLQKVCSLPVSTMAAAIMVRYRYSGSKVSYQPVLHLVDLLMQSRNTRWIAVMDHADAAIFTELIRNSAAHLLASGSHTFAAGDHAALPLRHVWAAASPAYSTGGLLASMLAREQYSFSIVERFLTQSAGKV